MIKILCDRCGAEIKPGKIGYVSLVFRETPAGGFVTENNFEDSHFCPTCMEKIADFIAHPLEKSEASTNGEPVKAAAPEHDKSGKARKPRSRIDYGKIMALHSAGWNNAKIADEMGMTPGAVATAISTYKKRMREGKADATNTE